MKTKLKLAVIAVALMASSTAALAQHGGRGYNGGGNNFNRGNTYVQQNNFNRGGYNGGYNRGYNNYNRGGNWNGNGWGYAGAAIAGALIGGAIANSYAAPVYGGGYAQPYYAPAPVYTPPVAQPYYELAPIPAPPRWHWEQQYDPSCNCVRNIQVMD